MFLVDYYRADIFERGEDCRARAYCDFGFARAQSPPLVETLACGKSAVQYCHLTAEARAELGKHLRR